MFRVGLTGGIASGKTTACQHFVRLGVDVFDADVVARELVQIGTPYYREIVQAFGSSFLLADKTINRPKLRDYIFAHEQAKQALETILHPAIHQQLIANSAQSHSPYCILAIPLLAESKISYPLNRILLVEATTFQQLERLHQRDNLSTAAAQNMITQQSTRAEKVSIADDIINNNASIDALKTEVNRLHQYYLQLAEKATIVAS